MRSDQPVLVVIGGPNGSGKTTLASYLIQKKRVNSQIINPDNIAFEELGSYQFQLKASRLALERRKLALKNCLDFAFESTFSGNSELNDIKAAKQNGYKVILYYVALESVIDNITRVKERQTRLGHDVENEDIVRRYYSSKLNLFNNIKLFDTAYLFDNSASSRSRVAIFSNGELLWKNRKHDEHSFFKEFL